MESNYKDLFDLVFNGPDSRVKIDRRQHTVVTNAGEVIDATETTYHYASGDKVTFTVYSRDRGITRDVKSYEEAIRIAEYYIERANAGASASELDSIL